MTNLLQTCRRLFKSPQPFPTFQECLPPSMGGRRQPLQKPKLRPAFGLPVSMTSKKGRNAGNAHTIVATGKGQPAIRCNAYGSHYPMKSNLGVVEELRRMEFALLPADEPSCPDPACCNHGVPVSATPLSARPPTVLRGGCARRAPRSIRSPGKRGSNRSRLQSGPFTARGNPTRTTTSSNAWSTRCPCAGSASRWRSHRTPCTEKSAFQAWRSRSCAHQA